MKKNIIIFVMLFLLKFPAFSNTIKHENISKEIFLTSFIKGINLADAKGKVILNKNKFLIEINAYTIGIFSIISNWQQTISSKGIYNKPYLTSYFYKSSDKRGKKKGHMHISFENNSPEIISAHPDPRLDNRRKKFNTSQLINTFDPIIGILNIGLHGKCKKVSTIFDGKRKYKIKSEFISKEKIKKNSFFERDFFSIKCKFDIEKVAGYTEKELKKYPSNGNIWFRKLEELNLYFPAKIEINSSWGSFISLIKEREKQSESNNL